MSIGAFLGNLGTVLDAAQGERDRRTSLQIKQLQYQQAVQQAQADSVRGKIKFAGVLGNMQAQQQPPGPYSVSQGFQGFGGGQGGGGAPMGPGPLPGAQRIASPAGMPQMPAPMMQMRGPMAGGGGGSSMPPDFQPTTFNDLVQQMQQSSPQGTPQPMIMQAARRAWPQVDAANRQKAAQYQAQQRGAPGQPRPLSAGPVGSAGGLTMPEAQPSQGGGAQPGQNQAGSPVETLSTYQPTTYQQVFQRTVQQAQAAGMDVNSPAVQRAIEQEAAESWKGVDAANKEKLEVLRAQAEGTDRAAARLDREQAHQDTEADRAASRALAAQEHADSMANAAATRALASRREDGADWTFMQDKDGNPLRANRRTGEIEPVENVQGLSRLGSSSGNNASADDIKVQAKAIANYEQPPISGARGTRVMAEVERQNPDYDGKKFQQYNAGYRAFSTGRQGDTVRSLGVADSHLEVLGGLTKALDNGNVRIVNNLAQRWAAATGSAAPTSFDAVKAIVADEVSKAVIGAGGGTGQDRENILAPFNRANSPQQLNAAISNYRKLMAGQLSGLRRQYKHATNRDDFDTLIPDDMKGAADAADSNAKADYSHLWGGQ
jgi:hypothetical protein